MARATEIRFILMFLSQKLTYSLFLAVKQETV